MHKNSFTNLVKRSNIASDCDKETILREIVSNRNINWREDVREMEFKMERPGLVQVGQRLSVKESKLPNSYYYTLEHSYAMSGNYPTVERLSSQEGVVKDVRQTDRGYYVIMEFDEPDIRKK